MAFADVKIAKVTWLDAWQTGSVELLERDVGELEAVLVRSVGYVIRCDKDVVVLAASIKAANQFGADEGAQDCLVIPRAMVTKLLYDTPAKKRPARVKRG